MTITEIRKTSGKGSYAGGQRSYALEFQVKFIGFFNEAALLLSGGTTIGGVTLPRAASTHPQDTGTYVNNIEATLEDESPALGTTDTPGVAKFGVTYTSNQFEQFGVHPLDRPPVIKWRGTGRTVVARYDNDGKAIANSAGDLYDPLPERPVPGADCTITFNVAYNPGSICRFYSNTTNSAGFFGVPIGHGLTGDIEADQASEVYGGVTVAFWQVTVPISFNNDGWAHMPIDNGFKFINDESKKQHATDDYGSRTPVPILLNGSGKELAQGGTPVVYPAKGYEYIDAVDWSSLNLPNPFA